MEKGGSQQQKDLFLSVHKKERKELRKECNDALAGKKGDERAAIESENANKLRLQSKRHEDELAEFMESLEIEGEKKGLSKSQLRYQKKKEKELEEEKRIQAANARVGPTHREIETAGIEKTLSQQGLKIKEIDSDGHCLYKALVHQMSLQGDNVVNSRNPHLTLRTLCAQYMTEHRHSFEPFLVSEDESTDISFEDYCKRIKETAEWGGQLELRALAGALKTPIKIITADSPVVLMGEEYSGNPFVVTYHRHYLCLGEHYNSAEPA